MKKYFKIMVMVLILMLSVSIFTGCVSDEEFAEERTEEYSTLEIVGISVSDSGGRYGDPCYLVTAIDEDGNVSLFPIRDQNVKLLESCEPTITYNEDYYRELHITRDDFINFINH